LSYPCCGFRWNVALFSPLLRVQPAIWLPQQLTVTYLKCVVGFMIFGSWYVNVGSPRRVIGVTDGQMDRQFSALYRLTIVNSLQTISSS